LSFDIAWKGSNTCCQVSAVPVDINDIQADCIPEGCGKLGGMDASVAMAQFATGQLNPRGETFLKIGVRESMLGGVLTLSTVFLAACTTPYIAPETSPKASLEINVEYATSAKGIIYVKTYADEACSPSPRGTRVATFNNSPLNTTPRTETVAIEADKLFVVTGHFSGGNPALYSLSCLTTLGFVPEANRKYILQFVATNSNCQMYISKQSDQQGTLERVPALPIRPPCRKD
jgi:hypothetical protein